MASPRALVPGAIYHIYNRGNNKDTVFLEPRNYDHFLQLYARFVSPVVDTYAYCLLPNHFHLAVRVNEQPSADLLQPQRAAASHELGRLFNAYTKAINKAQGRTGSLFAKPFRRVAVTSESQLMQLIVYIHRNPQRHGLVADFRVWKHSSYRAIQSSASTRLDREEMLAWFGGRQRFEEPHEELAREFGEP